MDIDLNEPTRPQLAALLGVSSRWIGELRSAGDLPADGATWAENLEAWIARQMPEDGAGGLSLDGESARLKKEQADAKAMDNRERRGELASRPDMMGAVVGLIKISVARLMQVPAAVAKNDAALRTKVERAMTDALRDLSVTKVEEAMGGGMDDDDAPDDEPGDS